VSEHELTRRKGAKCPHESFRYLKKRDLEREECFQERSGSFLRPQKLTSQLGQTDRGHRKGYSQRKGISIDQKGGRKKKVMNSLVSATSTEGRREKRKEDENKYPRRFSRVSPQGRERNEAEG